MAHDRSLRRLRSDRARIYIYATVAFLVLGFVMTIVAVWLVNGMKDRLVEQAKVEVVQSAQQLGEWLGEFLQVAGVRSLDSLDAERRGRVLEMVKRMAQQQTALTVFTLIEDGETVYYIDRRGTEAGRLAENPTGAESLPPGLDPQSPSLPPPGGEERFDVSVGATGPGEPNLQIAFHLSPQRIEAALKPTTQAITRVSWLLVGLLLALLLAGIVSLARALSHLMSLHDEANRLDRLAYVGTLAAGLAHEIRNPLNAMNINLDLVEEDIGTASAVDPSTRQMIGGVRREILRLNKTVGNFLAYARPSRRTQETVDLAQAVREALATLGSELEMRGVECQVGPLPEEAAVEIEPTGLHQALTNLLLNAAQAMDKPERRITVSGTSDGHRADITIADNGRGIPPDQLDRIFEVFFSTRSEGSGLGLPTARRVVEDVGGSITVDSTAGQGTQVTITLPLARRRGWR